MLGCVFERQKAVTVVTLLSSALVLHILLNNWGYHNKIGNLTKDDRIDPAYN